MATWDVFVSYRRVDPDQKWVRAKLVPQLRAAGLRVLLNVAEDGFVAGRDAICEMTRAGRESQRTLSARSRATATRVDPNAARTRVLGDLSARLTTRDPVERYWLYIALGSTGGADARDLLKGAANTETDPFARLGIEDALELLSCAPEMRSRPNPVISQ